MERYCYFHLRWTSKGDQCWCAAAGRRPADGLEVGASGQNESRLDPVERASGDTATGGVSRRVCHFPMPLTAEISELRGRRNGESAESF